MKLRFFFAWYDFWVGWYWDRKRRIFYVCPLPMVVFALEFKSKRLPVQEVGVGFSVRSTGEVGPDGVVENLEVDSVSLVSKEDGEMVAFGNGRLYPRKMLEKAFEEYSRKLRG